MSALLGIDIGTTTICGVAVSDTGELIASVERPNDSALTDRPAGRAEQDPVRIRERFLEVLHELTQTLQHRAPNPQNARHPAIEAIGLTGQMHGMLGVDAANEPCTPLITWQDGRCLEPDEHGRSTLDQIRLLASDDTWEVCGCRPASGFMGSTLFWLCRRNELPAEVERVCFIHDWLAGLLCHQLPVTDPSDAGSAGVFDLARLRWHDTLIKTLELPAAKLPEVRESGDVIGTLSTPMADAIGLASGVPICNAVGDNQASVIGSIADMERSILVNLGTGGQISWAIPSFERVEGMETRYLPKQRYMLVGASLCGGRAFAWLNDTVREWLGTFNIAMERDQVYSKLTALARAADPQAGGLTARTTLAGSRTDPALRGAFEEIGLDNFTLGNVARATLTGVIEELCAFHDGAGHKAAQAHTTVVASGNAVRKNGLLREILQERMARPVCIPQHREEAAFGAALLAGVGTGVWPDLAAAGQCVRYEST